MRSSALTTLRCLTVGLVVLAYSMVNAQNEVTPSFVTTSLWNVNTTTIILGWSDGTIEEVNTSTGLTNWRANGQKTGISTLAMDSRGSKLAAGAFDGQITFLDFSGTILATAHVASEPIATIQWIPNTNTVIVGLGGFDANDTLFQMDSNNAEIDRVFRSSSAGTHLLSRISTGMLVASLSPNFITLIDVVNGQTIAHIGPSIEELQNDNEARSLRWVDLSEDGRLVVVATNYGEVWLWDLSQTPPVKTEWQTGFPAPVQIQFGLGGSRVDFVKPDGTLGSIDVPTGSMTLERLAGTSADDRLSLRLSPFGGRILLTAPQEAWQTVQAAGGTTADMWQLLTVPASLTRVRHIGNDCKFVSDSLAAESVLSDSALDALTDAAIPAFIAQVEALPEGAIPPACKADLLAVARAVVEEGHG